MNVGIDIGGSHVGIGLVNPTGKILKKQDKYIKIKDRAIVDKFIIEEIVTTIKSWEKELHIKVKHIGIAAPGIVTDRKIKYSVNLGLYNYNLKDILSKYFPNVSIKLKNDAKCAALAEKNIGALKNYNDCVFLCLGTGIGGATFYQGKLISPRRSSGFEFGHMVIQKGGEPCRCGSRGCFEQYASMRKYKNNIRYNLNIPSQVDGIELRKIIKKNIDSNIVKNITDEYIENLCVGLSNIVNILEPQAICIGGGFVKYKEILLDRLKKEFYKSKSIFYKYNKPEIVVAKLGNDAGIIGSALFID